MLLKVARTILPHLGNVRKRVVGYRDVRRIVRKVDYSVCKYIMFRLIITPNNTCRQFNYGQ